MPPGPVLQALSGVGDADRRALLANQRSLPPLRVVCPVRCRMPDLARCTSHDQLKARLSAFLMAHFAKRLKILRAAHASRVNVQNMDTWP